MTFDEWIKNPAGAGSSVMTNRQMYLDLYTAKYNKLLLREGNQFAYYCYANRLKTHFLIHIKVPSESRDKYFYDVVLSFTTRNPAYATDNTIKRYDVQFYSNAPDFIYIHCHAYVKARLFYQPLARKMNKLSLTKPAEVRNPGDVVGYSKEFFFAYFIMQSKNLFSKDAYILPLSDSAVASNVRHADLIIEEIREPNKIKDQRLKPSTRPPEDDQVSVNPKPYSKPVGKVNTIKTTKSVGRIGNVKKTKRI